MRKKYAGKLMRLTGKTYDFRSTGGNTNAQSWSKILAAFKGREDICFEDLVEITKGHIHGTVSRRGEDSSSFITYMYRLGLLKFSDH